jgi:hypothetical protein
LFLTLASGSTNNSYATERNRASSKSDSSIDHLKDFQKERKLSAWWNLFTLVHGPCLPGKPGEKCRKEHELKAADNSAADTAADSDAAYDSSASYYSGSDSSSSVFSSYSSENGDEGGSAGTASKIGKFVNSPAGTATLITLSAVAASVAIAAILLVSKRRKNEGERHALHGTLKRRIGMFQHLASRTKCVTCRPEKANERGDNAADYRLA